MTMAAQTSDPRGAADRQAALAFLRRNAEMTSDSVVPVEAGWLVRCASLPSVWSVNHLTVVRPVTFPDAVSLADSHLHDLPYRHIEVEHEVTGRELEPRFVAAGWRVERLLLMALDGVPVGDADAGLAVEIGERDTAPLEEQWYRDMGPGRSDEVIRQLLEKTRREGVAWQERRFGVRADDGHVVAMTKLRSDGVTAQVEDVYTAASHRRRGYARALVTHAARLGGESARERVFLVADDDDWPKQLYARVGFRPVGLVLTFHQPAGDRS
jgi:ribosomal protein S18 acetylase RimI-like enzyme